MMQTLRSFQPRLRQILKAVVLILALIPFTHTIQAQGPYCIGENCTANDIQSPVYFLANATGTPITSVQCTPGQPVNNVYLWLTFQVTATNRYDVNVVGDVNVDGFYDHSFNVCLGDFGSGTHTLLIEQLVWDCGAELIISNTLFAWENNDDGQVPNSCNVCPSVPSKCDRFGNLVVQAPIVANFSYSTACVAGQPYQVFTFTDETTGGAKPYSNYVWNFGAGATPNPATTSGPNASGPFVVTYNSPGMRTVTLTVTDQNGVMSTVSHSINVLAVPTVNVIADDASICVGGIVLLTANVSGGTGASYQWQRLVSGVWTNVGTNQSTYTTPQLALGSHQYRVIVTIDGACTITSTALTITVVGDPTVSITAAASTICDGGSAMLTANVSGGTGITHYQWQQLIGGVWTNVGTDQMTYTSAALGLGSYDFRVNVSQDAGCNATSAGITIAVTTDPEVSVSLTDDEICEGGTVTFTAMVTGGAGNAHYQWQRYVSNAWQNVGLDQSTYTTPALTIGMHEFRVIVTQNSGCLVTSSSTAVNVVGDPTVSVSAVATSICTGGSAELTATINGGTGANHYQWQQLVNSVWTNVGADQATYTSGALTIGSYTFRVIASQDAGCSAFSDQVTITVVADPTVSVSGDNAQLCEGGSATLTAMVSGGAGATHYQWQQFINSVWTNVGADQSTYQTGALSIGTHQFRVNITQNSGCSATSTGFIVSVVGDPVVNVTADANAICFEGSALLTASVSGGTGTTHYQWQQLIGAVWTNVGADQPTYLASNLALGSHEFRVLISQNAGCNAASAGTIISVVTDPEVNVVADDNSICAGGAVTLTAQVTGGAGTPHFQWQQFVNGNWVNIGSDQNTYTTPALDIGDYEYRVNVTQNSGCSSSSASFFVSVVGDPTVMLEVDATSICTGGSANFTAIVTGGTGTTHYFWQRLINGVWTNVGADQPTFSTPVLPVGSYPYRVIVMQDAGCAVTSASQTINVVNDPTVSVQASDATICLGGSSTLFANVMGGAGTTHYQWQQLIGGVWTNVGMDQSSYIAMPSGLGVFQYRVIVTQNSGCSTTSASSSITVVGDPTVSISALETAVCDGGMGQLTATVSGGTGVTHYQWQASINGGPWNNVGADQNTYTTPALFAGFTYEYRVNVTQGAGCSTLSANYQMSVVNDPVVDVDSDDLLICNGGTATLDGSVTGGAGAVSYQWQQEIGGVWSNIPGANGPSYTTPPLTTNGMYTYRLMVMQNSGCDQASAPVVVTVVDGPTVDVQADANTICSNGSATLTAIVTGGAGPYSYQWEYFNGSIWIPVGTNSEMFTTGALTIGSYQYRVHVDGASGCSLTSGQETITVVTDPTVSVSSSDNEICDGGEVVLTANVSGGAGMTNFQWQFYNGTNWVNVGSNQNTYNTGVLNIGIYLYRVMISQNSGCETTSANAQITVVGDPTVSVSATETTICNGGVAALHATVVGGTGVSHYEWQVSVNGGPFMMVGADAPDYTSPPLSLGDYEFRVIVMQDAGCEVLSDGLTISVIDKPTVDVEGSFSEICDGGSVLLTAIVTGGAGATDYQWQRLVNGMWTNVGMNQPTYQTQPLSLGTHEFRVLISQNSGCDATSANFMVTVLSDPTVSASAEQSSICDGGMAHLFANVTGGAGTTHYQWQQFIGGVWVNVGTDDDEYLSGPLGIGMYSYQVLISQNSGCFATSAVLNINVVADPTVMIDSDDDHVCLGETATLNAVVTGGAGMIHYQWQQWVNGSWVNVGTDAPQYITPVLPIGMHQYQVLISQNSGCFATSATFEVTVTENPSASTSPNATICSGESIQISVTPSGGTGPYTYLWSNGAMTQTITVSPVTTTNYTVTVFDAFGCSNTSTAQTIISVNPSPSVNLGPNQIICLTDTLLINAAVSGGTAPFTYAWSTGETTEEIEVFPTMTTLYTVTVTDDNGCTGTDAIQVTVNPCIGTIAGYVLDEFGSAVPNVKIYLYEDTNADGNADGSPIDSTLTDGDTGAYIFEDKEPGFYVVVEVQPGNYDDIDDYDRTISASDPDGDDSAEGSDNDIPVFLAPMEGDFDNNFVEDANIGSITGTVKTDFDEPIADVVIRLYGDANHDGVADGPVLDSTLTDSLGQYEFFAERGYYVLFEVQPANHTSLSDYDFTTGPTDMDGDDSAQGADDDIPVRLLPGEVDADNDFIEDAHVGLICGNVSDDMGNIIPNVTLSLYSDPNGDGDPGDGMLITSVVNDGETGNYCFEDIEQGVYVIVETQPANYDDVSDYDHSTGPNDPDGDDSGLMANNWIPVILVPAEADLDNDFIEDANVGSITGQVREDIGAPIPGVTLNLYEDLNEDGLPNDGPPIGSTMSDAGGFYQFTDLEPGHYLVQEVQLPGFTNVSDIDGSITAEDPDGNDGPVPNDLIPVILSPGEIDADNDFVNFAPLGVICGNVSDDTGSPVANVTLDLYTDPNGDGDPADGMVVATVLTDGETGDFCFEDVYHGVYVIVEEVLPNYDDVSDYDESTGGFDPDGDDSSEGADNNIPVVLIPAEGDMDNNFVEDPHVGNITGQVREDLGIGISGVILQLWNDFNHDGLPDPGAPIASVPSDGSGNYAFNGMEPGHYVVVEIQPTGYTSVSDIDGSITPADPDGNDGPTPNEYIPVVLSAGEIDADNDFVENASFGVICGSVLDINGNPLSNVTLNLYTDPNGDGDPADGVIYATVVNDGETGGFCFEDIYHDTYVIVEQQPSNYQSVEDFDMSINAGDPDGDDSALGPNEMIPVLLLPGELDADNDFIEDPDEGFITGEVRMIDNTPIPGVTIYLFTDANQDGIPDGSTPILTQVTDAMGQYAFNQVEIGGYVVSEVQPGGFGSISDIDGSINMTDPDGNDGPIPNDRVPVVVSPGETDADNDFVEEAYLGVICGQVVDDGGNVLANVVLNLYSDPNGDGDPADGMLEYTTSTDGETGGFCFEDVSFGDYVIVEVQPSNYTSVSDYDHTTGPGDMDGDDSALGPNEYIPVTLLPGEADLDNIFIEHPDVGNIFGQVIEDFTLIPVVGVTIQLFSDVNQDNIPDTGTPIATTMTDAMGQYSFSDVPPGGYVLVEINPAGYTSVSDVDGSINASDPDGNDGGVPNEKIPVVITPGENDEDNDFIEFANPGLICGTVKDDMGNILPNIVLELYTDANGDGIPDTGIPDLTVVTDGETGTYCFEDVPHGIYVIVEVQPTNYDDVSDYDHSIDLNDPDGDDSGLGPNNKIPVVLEPAEADLDNDFIEDPHIGNITGNVRDDAGIFLAGVTIRLFNDANQDGIPDGGVIASVVTDAMGDYGFIGMETGGYLLDEIQPAGYESVSDIDGSINAGDPDGDDGPFPNERIPVVLLPGETDADNDFVEYPLPGLICGRVIDNVGNPLANITLELIRDVNGNGVADDPVVATTLTDGETGGYCFEDAAYGEYFVREIHPTNYNSESDYDHTTGPADPDGDDSALGPNELIFVDLVPAEADLDNDFIEIPNPGTISGYVLESDGTPISNNTLGVYADPEQDGIPNGGAIGSVMTNGMGYYAFVDLDNGSYVVIQTQPVNFFSVSDVDATPDPDGFDGNVPNERILVVLDPGEQDEDNNFIEDPFPGAICGLVLDIHGNVMPNVAIELYADNGNGMPTGPLLASTLTDGETGGYCFEDLHYGGYVVVQIQPANYTSVYDYDFSTNANDPDGVDTVGGPNNLIPAYLEPGEGDFDNNFIENPNPGSILGQVRDDAGTPMPGVTINLHLDTNGDGGPDGPPIGNTVTDASGNYVFNNVEFGNYVVKQVQPTVYFSLSDYDHSISSTDPDGDDSAQGPDEEIPVTIDAGEVDADNDFEEIPFPSTICGTVTDEVGNPLPNVQVRLHYDVNGDGIADMGIYGTTVTDGETGLFCFEDVPIGQYVLVEVPPGNYQFQTDYDHTTGPSDPDGDDSAQGPDGDIPVVTTPGEGDFDNDFVNISCPGLPEVIGGDEYFTCDGGTVTIAAVQQPLPGVSYHWTFGDLSTPPEADGPGPHMVSYGWSQMNQDSGAQVILTLTKPGCPTQTGEVARVYVSPIPDATINADVFDLCAFLEREFVPAAPEIPGGIYTWDFGIGAVPATATGYGPHAVYYTFTGPKTVQLIVDPNYPVLESCPDTASVSFNVINCPGSIAGIVKNNVNAPLQGFPIELHEDADVNGQPDGTTPLETTFSNSQGQFAFTQILPGNYVLKQVEFPGYLAVWDGDVSPDGDNAPNVDIMDELIPVTVDPGQDDIGNTFIKTNDIGSINGIVYGDEDEDGVYDLGEGIEGVKLRLFADNDVNGLPDNTTVLDSVLTNAFGVYAFLLVQPGDYVVVEVQPVGYSSLGDQDITPDGDLAPNVDPLDNIIPASISLMDVDGGNHFRDKEDCSLTVLNTNNSGYGSLRAAIECAAPGETIVFAPDLAGDTIVTSGSVLTIDKNLMIDCTLPQSVVLISTLAGHFEITEFNTVGIHNLQIISGVSGAGAALINAGTLTLDDVIIRANSALSQPANLIMNYGQLTWSGTNEVQTE